MPDLDRYLPLTPRLFHILLALGTGPKNGYQVSVAVEENSKGAVRLRPATQFENLNRLVKRGLVDEARDDPTLQPDGRGQRFWRLTDLGERVLRAEVRRLADDLAFANAHLRLRD